MKEFTFLPEEGKVTLIMPVVDPRAEDTIRSGLAAQRSYRLAEPSEIKFSMHGTRGIVTIKNNNLIALAGDAGNVMASRIEVPIDRLTVKFADADFMNSVIGQIGAAIPAGHERAQVSRVAELIAEKITGRG